MRGGISKITARAAFCLTNMTNKLKLSARLAAAAKMCRDGSLADIGTDHALLPISLVLAGHPRAAACDIREGPCERARENVARFGLNDCIEVFCRPGLEDIESFAPDNIFICGMGGEMISSILAASEYPKASKCRLILQPQSMQEVLRAYLSSNGFSIIDEQLVLDAGKYYQLICAEYTGESFELSPVEQRLGRINLERTKASLSDIDKGWLGHVLASAERRVEGRKNAAETVEKGSDEELISMIRAILEKG